jgi:uncharacterized protein YlxW (UPF0749 family)
MNDAPPPRSRRPALLTRESWAKRIASAKQMRSRAYREQSLFWRLLAPAVFLLAGALFVTSAISAQGTDLRAGRYGDLSSVVRQASEDADELRERRNELAQEVEELTAALADTGVGETQAKADALRVPAGLAGMRGPGLTVELDDAPSEAIARSGVKPEYLVVHQQDIQAVVNAMWAGGAEAMTIQGQRVISTTGIKCVGPTVVLHGIPYSPPYVITAVGDPAAMLAAINDSPYIDIYLDYVEAYGLGWDVLPHSMVELPPSNETLDLDYARPVGEREGRDDDGV